MPSNVVAESEEVIELVTVQIREGQQQAFERAYEQAMAVIVRSPGCSGVVLNRCVEEPQKYVLAVTWETLEAHTQGYRGSELSREAKSLIGVYRMGSTSPEHYRHVASIQKR